MTRTGSLTRTIDSSDTATRILDALEAELCDPVSGELDARKIGELFGLPLSPIVGITGQEKTMVQVDRDAVSTLPLSILARIAGPLLLLVGTRKAVRIWMNTPNSDLGGATPLTFVEEGKGETVVELLEDALVGQPG